MILRKKLILILLFISSIYWAQGKEQPLILENDFVRFEFEKDSYGLSAMIDKTSNVNHITGTGKGHYLFDIVLRNGLQEGHFNNVNFQGPYDKIKPKPLVAKVDKKSDGTQIATIEWKNINWWKEKSIIDIKVTIELPANSGIAKWRISVDNRSDLWGLWNVKFPYFSGLLKDDEYDFAYPCHNGGKFYKKINYRIGANYPSQSWTSQFFSISKGVSSIYYAALDPGSRRKGYKIVPEKDFYIRQDVENMAVPGSDYQDYFPQEFGVFQGNWIDAAKRYRKWAIKQRWTEMGKKLQRKDMPDIINNVALWFQVGKNFDTDDIANNITEVTIDEIRESLVDANKKLNVPLGVHWYKWHKTPYDTYYPHFLPGRDGFKDAVKELTAKGMLIMPYINGLIADVDNYDFDKYLLHCVKDQIGAPTLHRYGKTSARLVGMCSTQIFWHNQIAGLLDTLVNDYGVNGVYIDQISASTPKLCFDKSHGHPLGGGRYWVDGYQKFLDKMRKIASSNGAILVSENTAEPYMNKLDGFLSWHEPEENDIPMLQMVYSDYTNYVGGRVSNIPPISDKAFIMAEGRFYIWGFQNGWMNPWFMKKGHEKKAEYFKKIGRYRVATRKFVTYGELMDLITFTSDVPMVKDIWVNHYRRVKNVSIPSIQGAIWKAENDDLALILVNLDDKVHEVKYVVETSKYGVQLSKNAHYVINHITLEKKIKLENVESNKIERTEKMEPGEIKVLEISETED